MNTAIPKTVRAALVVGLLVAFPALTAAQNLSNANSGTRGNDTSSGTTSDTGTSTNESQSTGYGPQTNGFALLSVQVSPVDAEIYVDGEFKGTAENFNQGEEALKLKPGAHVIVLYHPERRTVRMEVRVASGQVYSLKNEMPNLDEDEIAVRPVAALFKIFIQDFNNHQLKPTTASVITAAAS
jgi:hypothetical protein